MMIHRVVVIREMPPRRAQPERVVEREVPFGLRGFLPGRNFFKLIRLLDFLEEVFLLDSA